MWKTLGKSINTEICIVEKEKGYPLDKLYLKAFALTLWKYFVLIAKKDFFQIVNILYRKN
jgi:hypothetical protein